MKVLVATRRTQGLRSDDYCWTIDGELVLAGALIECCLPERCGCGRAFPGLASSRATTTAIIVERPELDMRKLSTAVGESLDRQGYLDDLDDDEADDIVERECWRLASITRAWPVGTVLERRGGLLGARQRVA
jgi:hypothetical protein